MFNARSVCNKLAELNHLILSETFDIVFIVESWLSPSIPDSLLVNGAPYNVFRKDRLSSHGGGLCILAKRNLKIVIKNSVSPDILMIQCISHLINFNFVLCYRPPQINCQSIVDFNEKKLIIEKLINPNCSTVILVILIYRMLTGILCHIIFPIPVVLVFKFITPSQLLSQKIISPPFVFEPTRGSNLLDQILCNDPCAIFNVQVDSPFSSSDHNSVTFNLLLPTDPQLNVNNTDFPRFDYRNADWNCINAEFCKINWIHQIDQLDCDQVYDFFMSSLIEILSRSLPIFSTVNRKFKKPFKYPKYILKLQSAKRSSWRLWKEFRTPKLKSDYLQAAQAYRSGVLSFTCDFEGRLINSGNVGRFYSLCQQKIFLSFGYRSHSGPRWWIFD